MEKVLRIGISCNSFARSGGMEQYALNVIEALIHLGHTPVVFTMSADTTLPFYDRAEVHILPRYKWLPNKLNVVRFNRWLKNIRHEVPTDFMIACCIAATAEIAVCGGNHIGYLKAMGKRPQFFDRWIIAAEREMYGNARLIVAHSQLMKQELHQFYGIDSNKIEVKYAPQVFRQSDTIRNQLQLREQFRLPTDKTLFLFPSSSHKRKGFDLLRQYFEQGDGSEVLVVVGKPLKRSHQNVVYAGYCADMQSMYRAVNYTVLASIYEPFGLVPVESVWNGTPVLISQNLGCCEILDDRSARFFKPNDLADFKRVMQDVREHPIHLEAPYQKYINMRTDVTIEEHVQELCSRFL